MPTIGRYRGYTFKFFSNEGNPIEPIHVHIVYNNETIAKYWILRDGTLRLAADSKMEIDRHVLDSMRSFVDNAESIWIRKFGSIRYIDD